MSAPPWTSDDEDFGPATLAEEEQDAQATSRGLVLRALRGEQEAFGQLYRTHLAAVYRHVLFHVGDGQVAEDLTQDVFVRAFDNLRGIREPDRFRTWLFRIAHNTVKNHRRFRARHPEDAELDPIAGTHASNDLDESVNRSIALEAIQRAAATLPPRQREVIALRFAAGLSTLETAEVTGASPAAVRNAQHHALATLRRLVSEGQTRAG